ncbi:hypothetical protein RRG08_028280 [Elysia crispata]|uniref:Uncharacterized protein n=1 Tax=Elysia crispata TaxID=231223 RepID=A0AAE1AWA3_9GAST|nr:hypothetical protein RRG08_028280 [Elysia crispata]
MESLARALDTTQFTEANDFWKVMMKLFKNNIDLPEQSSHEICLKTHKKEQKEMGLDLGAYAALMPMKFIKSNLAAITLASVHCPANVKETCLAPVAENWFLS